MIKKSLLIFFALIMVIASCGVDVEISDNTSSENISESTEESRSNANQGIGPVIHETGTEIIINEKSGDIELNISYPETGIENIDNEILGWITSVKTKYTSGTSGAKSLKIVYNSYIINDRFINIEINGRAEKTDEQDTEYFVESFNIDREEKLLLDTSLIINKNQDFIAILKNKVAETSLSENAEYVDASWAKNIALNKDGGIYVILTPDMGYTVSKGIQYISITVGELGTLYKLDDYDPDAEQSLPPENTSLLR